MSVDRRLRQDLRAAADAIEVSSHDAYPAIVAAARRQQVRSRARTATLTALAAAAAVVALAVLVVLPAGRPSSTPATTSSTVPNPGAALTGTWQAGPVRLKVLADDLRANGLGQWVTAYLDGVAETSTVTLTLKLQAGQLTLTRAVDGTDQGVEDAQAVAANADRVTFRTQDAERCSTTFGWQVSGGSLRFTYVSGDCPSYRGTPNEVFMRALYTSTPFTRLPD